MADIFRNIIFRLQDIGAFNFLFPFFLTTAVIYGLLRKSQIFGDPDRNVAVNAVIALVAGFMVWAYPILSGVNIEAKLSAFFIQGIAVTLVFMVVLLAMGMIFPPNLPEQLSQALQGRWAIGAIIVSIILGLIIFVTSGLWSLFVKEEVVFNIPSDVIWTLVALAFIVLPLIIIMGMPIGGKPQEKKGSEHG